MPDTDEGNGNRGCIFFERGFGKKDTSWEGEGQKRHKLDVRVVPYGGKKRNKLKPKRNKLKEQVK